MRILAVGGGSGGHVTPVVPVIDELKQLATEPLEVRFVCDRSFAWQAQAIMKNASQPIAVSVVVAGKLRRYANFKWVDYLQKPQILVGNIIDMGKVVIGLLQSLWLIARFRPKVVFAKGGYVCLPVSLAARLMRVPVVIHDSDARPGLTNRLIAPFASAIATGYPLDNYPYPASKSYYTGVPVRAEYKAPGDIEMQKLAKTNCGFDPQRPLKVAVGGGLGARPINEAVLGSMPRLVDKQVQVLLVAGKAQYDAVQQQAKQYSPSLRAVDFIAGGMADYLMAADIVITRASATFLQEIAGLAKPAIVIPARQLGDQKRNAKVYRDKGAAVVYEEHELAEHPGRLADTIMELLSNDVYRHQLQSSIHSFARPQAAYDVAKVIWQVVEDGR